MTRWVSLNQLVEETGLARRTLQYIRTQEPGVLVQRTRGKVTEYRQPDCSINLRTREAQKALADARPVTDIDEAKERARKMRADADKAEAQAAALRGELAPVAEMDRAVERLADAVRAEVAGLRSRYTLSLVGLTSPAEAAAVVDQMARQVLQGLAARAEAMDEDDDDAEAAA